MNAAVNRGRCLAIFVTLVLLAAVGLSQNPPAADAAVINAKLYTVDPRQPWAEALAISGGKIVMVGSDHEVARYCGPSTQIIDAQHHLALPGFTDSHIHFLDGSLSVLRLNLDEAKTIAEIQRLVKQFAEQHPTAPWILGRGWLYEAFGTSGMPDKRYLDEIVANRPVYLEGFDAHTWWANSKALQLAGITRKTPDPPTGTIVRDAGTGEPTGVIKEDAADELIRRSIPQPDHEEKLRTLRQGMREANQVGLVRVISPDGTSAAGGDFEILDLYDDLRRQGQLSLRFYIAKRLEPPAVTSAQIQAIANARRRYHDEWISAGAAKFFLDGVIESRQAVRKLDQQGFQVLTHAIGDKAVRLALDAYEGAARANHTKTAHHRIEHIETISAVDIQRFGKLNVIASMQPLHAYPNDDTLRVWARNTGPERTQRAWAWHSIEIAGGVLAFGSDWPVVTLNP